MLGELLSDPYYLYILHSEAIDRFYVGISHDPNTRLRYHNISNKGWTRKGRPWSLVFKQTFSSRGAAQKAERLVKGQKSSIFIRKLISGEYILDP